jgi:hypothetical protein
MLVLLLLEMVILEVLKYAWTWLSREVGREVWLHLRGGDPDIIAYLVGIAAPALELLCKHMLRFTVPLLILMQASKFLGGLFCMQMILMEHLLRCSHKWNLNLHTLWARLARC